MQLAWMKRAPSPQRADPPIPDRLARIDEERDDAWCVVDDHGERHVVDRARREVLARDDAAGRWVVQGPVPAWSIGEALRLEWLERNCGWPETRRPGRDAQVVAEDAETVSVVDDAGERHVFVRANGHPPNADRRRPRWVICSPRVT